MPGIQFGNKKYGDKYALNNVSFSLECNKSYSLIGPNGAGKSTILKIISGLISPDAGNVSIKGNKPGSDEAKNYRISCRGGVTVY